MLWVSMNVCGMLVHACCTCRLYLEWVWSSMRDSISFSNMSSKNQDLSVVSTDGKKLLSIHNSFYRTGSPSHTPPYSHPLPLLLSSLFSSLLSSPLLFPPLLISSADVYTHSLFVEYGMPSSHAQFMAFFATYFTLFLFFRSVLTESVYCNV